MRPIKLTVEGFTSFRSRQVIDFNELDLFAITGATGAGKSSLLDAITYAIYEKVPRLNVRDHGKELVSLGADNLKVEFQFAVRKQEYSVIRSWRSRRKNPEKKCLLYRLQNGTWEPCSLKVEEIVGMDFDTFTRVILLPQGHFDEFLKGDNGKRRIILRELAGFEIFEEMRKKASEREKEAKAHRQILEASLNDLNPPTEDEIAQKREVLIRLEQERIPQLQQQEKVSQTQLNSEEKLLELVNKLAETQKKLSVLVQNESQILTLTHRLEQAQKTDKIKDKWALVNQARTEYKKAQDAIKLAENQLSQSQKQFENTKLELREQLGKRLGVLEIQRREAERQYQEAEYLLTRFTPGGKRLEKLNQVLLFLGQFKQQQKQVDQKHQGLPKLTQQIQESERNYQTVVLPNLNRAEEALKQAEKALLEAEKSNEQVKQNNHAAAIRSSLHTGDDCPVCGGIYSEEHHLTELSQIDLINLEPLQLAKKQAEADRNKADKKKTELETEIKGLKRQEKEQREDLATAEASLMQTKREINQVLEVAEWEPEALEKERQELADSDRKHKEALEKKNSLQHKCERIQDQLELAKNEYNEFFLSREESSTEQQQRVRSYQEEIEKLIVGKSDDNIDKTLDKCLAAFQNIPNNKKLYNAQTRELIRLESVKEEAINTEQSSLNKKQESEANWQEALKKSGLTEDSFLEEQASPEQQEQWHSQIQEHRDNKQSLNQEIDNLNKEIDGKTTTQERVEELKKQLQFSKNELQEASENKGKLSTWIDEATKKLKKALEYLTQKEEQLDQEQTYHTLALDLQSDRFQDYVLENLEKELVGRATVLMKQLTDNRYSLIVHRDSSKAKDKDYYVEDNWNGGEIRRVQTLSGGETFAASLSMALALSEKLSMGVELGSLFLDEGFGTLDAETLETVTQILESLRQQDRIIGVITHISALAERLPTQVQVRKSPAGSNLAVVFS